MKYILSYTSIALVIFLQKYECMETTEQRVKLVAVEVPYTNPKYIQNLKFSVVRKNDTYNQLKLSYDAPRDFPKDMRYRSVVYATNNSNYANAKLILVDESFFHKKAKHYNLLPYFLESVKTAGGTYYQKGHYENEDVGQFRFEILVPNLDERGKYYKARYMLIAPKETVHIATYYSEWAFLKNREDDKFWLN